MTGPFDPALGDLPPTLAVFPLTGVLLLPGGRLPLNIFEPRYLAMTRSALATGARLIGMVQPTEPTPDDNRGPIAAAGRGPVAAVGRGDQPGIYRTGCAGRITSFVETDDGRYGLTLTGVCRFDVSAELPPEDGFRRVTADYGRFRDDLAQQDHGVVDRTRLDTALRVFFQQNEIDANWESIGATPDGTLVTSLAMTCPFSAGERQALLEAPDLTERARVLVALLEMSLLDSAGGAQRSDH
jgi:Lon protease-like protein